MTSSGNSFLQRHQHFLRYASLNPARQNFLLGSAFLLFVVIVIYIPATYGGFVWDDDIIVQNNVLLRSWDGLYKIWFSPGEALQYYPIVHMSNWIEMHLWGPDPLGYHLVNMILHAMNSILLWRLLRSLDVPGAWMIACLFAVHPVHVESVAWISERKNTLSAFFYLLSLLMMDRYQVFSLSQKKGDPKYYWLALLYYLGALHSKTVTFSLPVVALLLVWWKKGRIQWKRDVVPFIPFFAFGGMLGAVTVLLEKYRVGAIGSDWALSFPERCLVAGKAFWFYWGKLVWPHPLIFFYPKWKPDLSDGIQIFFSVSIPAAFFLFWVFKRNISRGPFTALFFFFISIFPALGFFNTYPMRFSYVADHFQYLASIGPLSLYVGVWIAAVTFLFRKSGLRTVKLIGFYIIPIPILIIFSWLAWKQCHIYKDYETLYADIIKKNPNAFIAYNNLGVLLSHVGEGDDALRYYTKAVEVNPQDHNAIKNLGRAMVRKGRYQDAVSLYSRSIEIDPDNTFLHNDLGLILMHQGNAEEAFAHFLESIKTGPINPDPALLQNLDWAFEALPRGKNTDSFPEILRLDRRKLVAGQGNNRPALIGN